MPVCPACDSALDVEESELEEGDAVICDECGSSVNVDRIHPLELSEAEEDDDFEDDEDDDDYEDDEDDEEADE